MEKNIEKEKPIEKESIDEQHRGLIINEDNLVTELK